MFAVRRASGTILDPRAIRASLAAPARHLTGDSYNDDHIVPDFYARRTKGDPSTLLEALNLNPRQFKSKVPTELKDEDGNLVHPSGFVIPTPGDAAATRRPHYDDSNLAAQTAAVQSRVEEEASLVDVTARTRSNRAKVPFEVKGVDGIFVHPSGFVPPTAAHEFKLHQERDSSERQNGNLPGQSSSTSGTPYSAAQDPLLTSSNPRSTATDPEGPHDKKLQERQFVQVRSRSERTIPEPTPLMPGLTDRIMDGGVEASTAPKEGKVLMEERESTLLGQQQQKH